MTMSSAASEHNHYTMDGDGKHVDKRCNAAAGTIRYHQHPSGDSPAI